ncbi:MAG TPA: FAD:protein FMN transferase, partial [Patescibacteria group bacterium]|nr:FAD:protein FMN transferase [Patescibacteria group bacterium]
MKETRLLMGMPITVEVVGGERATQAIDDVFNYFHRIDEQFSTYKESSEISRINRDELTEAEWSEDIRLVFALCEQTNRETNGYFDIRARNGLLDPSGLVKGWAIRRAAELLDKQGWKNFFVDAGGDIQARGKNERNEPWRVGIQNPFNTREIIKI